MGIISSKSVIIKQGKNLNKLSTAPLLMDAVKDNEKDVLDQQRAQLLTGRDNQGKKIKPKYRGKEYTKLKQKMNPLAGRGTPDLKLSGDLHDSLDLAVGVQNDSSYTVFSNIEYFKDLAVKYNSAFDLSKKNALKVVSVNNSFMKSVHKKINE